MVVVGFQEVRKMWRRTFTTEGRAEKQREFELKTYQTALAQFNEALSPFDGTMRLLNNGESTPVIADKRESHVNSKNDPYTHGQISYTDLRIARNNGTYIITATADVDNWIVLSLTRKDGGQKLGRNHHRQVQRDVIRLDENTGDVTQAESGRNFSKLTRGYEAFLKKQYPRKFRNAKTCVEALQVKPVKTLPEQTAAIIRVTQLLQKASGLEEKKK